MYPNKIASYSKGLPHNNLGEVDLDAYHALIRALTTGNPVDLEHIHLGGDRKLVNPKAALAFGLEGPDSQRLAIPPAPTFSSAEEASEMGELYWQSPTHPSYPAGHATVAGACATVLKAFFNETFVIPNPVVTSADGLLLLPYEGPGLTVGSELDKLTSNFAIGRNAAGVHWRSDSIKGLKLGEAVAIGILTEMRSTYNEKFGGFSLTKFDGMAITI